MFKCLQDIFILLFIQNTYQFWIDTLKKLLVVDINSSQQIQDQNLLVYFVELEVILIERYKSLCDLNKITINEIDVVCSHSSYFQFQLLLLTIHEI